jgi:hypothetical protein
MQAVHPDLDEVVDVREESGRIVMEPAWARSGTSTNCYAGSRRKTSIMRLISDRRSAKEIW